MIAEIKIGLKVWSTNVNLPIVAENLFLNGVLDYVEVFVVIDSSNTISAWEGRKFPIILHAPHSYAGFNPSISISDCLLARVGDQLAKFARALNPIYVIFHAGINGNAECAASNLSCLVNSNPFLIGKAIIENKPYDAINGERCVGATVDELELIMQRTGFGLCLDFAHAACAAASLSIPILEMVNQLSKLAPKMYHISDGWVGEKKDLHLQLGAGNYDIKSFLSFVEEGSMISLETSRPDPDAVCGFKEESGLIKRYFQNIKGAST